MESFGSHDEKIAEMMLGILFFTSSVEFMEFMEFHFG